MSTTVIERDGLVFFSAGMAIDGDGSYRCYAPRGSGLVGLDTLGNAGTPAELDSAGVVTKKANWYGIVTDNGQKDGTPIIQSSTDPAPGYYVSPTALRDKSKKLTDPRAYVDSCSVPYISIPSDFKHNAHLGDLAMVAYHNLTCPAIIADIGPKGKAGEGSVCLADHLGIPSSPRNGGAAGGVRYVIFPGSGTGWPNPNFQDKAQALFDKWGGLAKLNTVLV